MTGTPRLPVGTTFDFTLNEPAGVRFAFTRRLAGRRAGSRCVAPTRRNAHNRQCTLTLPAGTLSVEGHAGTNRVNFRGRVSSTRELVPGRYALVITAVGPAGQRSASGPLGFTIAAR